MIRPFDIVRLTPEFVDRELRAMLIITIDPNQDLHVVRGNVDSEQRKQWLKFVGIVTETDGKECHIEWFDKDTNLHNAWWDEKDLEVVNNLVVILADRMSHPFGKNTEQGEKFYGAEK